MELFYALLQKSPSGRETTFKLKKRYSDFARLFTSLKQIFPGIESFSFPKKSVFSNQSQHVKERRRQSFDDFLKVLVRMDPLPIEVADFLELCANTPTESKSIFPEAIRNMMSGTSTITKETPPSPKESSSPEIAKPALSRLASDKLKLASITTATGSKDLTTFVKLLPSSVFLVVPIYAVLVGFDFIDISTTTTGKLKEA